eukprot:TRINITY_DN6571_c0_g1_i1.p1 TRINITY_DN6571_c0_g1~~TRINITY_DN6571_c0_g1_i1.p1  ORF type:complete len:326 (-),score=69.43 TRINITY_DN6571_c0_g1_i1:92-1069(-)
MCIRDRVSTQSTWGIHLKTSKVMEAWVCENPKIVITLLVIAAIYPVVKILEFLRDVLVVIFRRGYDLEDRYGSNSWAVVTGASDGIGKQFCFSLARRNFNIVLIARNQSKLERVASEIREAYENVATRIIVANFDDAAEKGFIDNIQSQLSDLDISILINNVGIFPPSTFSEASLNEVHSTLTVNIYPMVLLSRVLIPQMLRRQKKSGIINLSSGLGLRPFAYVTTYSSTKAFADFFSRGIAYEFEDKIDILSHMSGMVSTNMTENKNTNFANISREDAVEGILRELGHETRSAGNWHHKFLNALLDMTPEFVTKRLIKIKKESK